MRPYFLKSQRLGFSHWREDDLPLAQALWGDPLVTRYICASGRFSPEEVQARLNLERENFRKYGVQYFPVFRLEDGELVGCCGLRPYGMEKGTYEMGIHLRSAFWRQGYGREAAEAMISYAFDTLHASSLMAGHNPRNLASKRLLAKLGFQYEKDEFYAPTGLYHPSYTMKNPNF